MLLGIDISHYEKGLNLASVKPGFCIVKATEGTGYVDNCCDGFITQCKNLGIPWGYYHFAKTNNPEAECDFFINQTRGYSKKGIPVLDYEVNKGKDYVGRFVQRYHDKTGVWPWVYMNNDFVQRGMFTKEYRDKCGLWIARYPVTYTTYPQDRAAYPYNLPTYTVVCWQFTENLEKEGFKIDGDICYLNKETWKKYANPQEESVSDNSVNLNENEWKLARDVINGKFGDGETRKSALGSKYANVQSKVNALLQWPDYKLAKYVINGELGNGDERKYILGERYGNVQKRVNKML